MHKFHEMREQWHRQREQYSKWEQTLIAHSVQLKNSFAEYLGIEGKTWKNIEAGNEPSYVYLTSLNSNDSSELNYPSVEEINEFGELALKLIVTLDNADNTYPKYKYGIPIALKMLDKEINYCFWDTTECSKEVNSQWTNSLESILDEMVKRFMRHFSFDPMDGIPEKNGIGFIPS
jgi:hypothetical protein